jgi:hypothetical protein
VRSSVISNALLIAIGRVAVESAELERSLRYLLDDLAPMSDDAWFLWEGQPTDWMHNAALAVLRTKRHTSGCDGWPERIESLSGESRVWLSYGTR